MDSEPDSPRGPNDDDDFDMAEDTHKRYENNAEDGKTQAIPNHHYDEAVDISESGSEVPSDPEPQEEEQQQEDEEEEADTVPSPPQKKVVQHQKFEPIRASKDSNEDEDRDGENEVGGYNPSDYANLGVSAEVQDLFKYITRFKPAPIELDTKLKAFIPDYIPAVGEVDAFLKPARPDNQIETLGLLTIDEPSLNQTREAKANHIVNAFRKTKRDTKKVVDSIENADKNPREINKWIQDVTSIQRQPPSVAYSKPFPEIDNLMQEWPAEIEDALQNLQLPTEDMDMTLEEYAKLCCALVDIPVHQTTNGRNIIESMHVFFTLYAEFKANQHFQQQGEQFVYEGNGPM